jgi:hypothetical protein
MVIDDKLAGNPNQLMVILTLVRSIGEQKQEEETEKR